MAKIKYMLGNDSNPDLCRGIYSSDGTLDTCEAYYFGEKKWKKDNDAWDMLSGWSSGHVITEDDAKKYIADKLRKA